MGRYAPSRKVLAGALTAVVATALFLAGHVEVETVVAAWGVVAAAYGAPDGA